MDPLAVLRVDPQVAPTVRRAAPTVLPVGPQAAIPTVRRVGRREAAPENEWDHSSE